VTSIRNGMQNGQTEEVFTEKTKKESMHGRELKICTKQGKTIQKYKVRIEIV